MDAHVYVSCQLPYPIFVSDEAAWPLRAKTDYGWMNLAPDDVQTDEDIGVERRPTDPELDMKRGIWWVTFFTRLTVMTDRIPDFENIAERDEDAIIHSARSALNQFLELVRIITGQTWVRPMHRGAGSFRVWATSADGTTVPFRKQNRRAQRFLSDRQRVAPAGVSAATDHWRLVQEGLVSGRRVTIWERFLLDAEEMCDDNPEMAVLQAAIACEVYIGHRCNELAIGSSTSSEFWKWLVERRPRMLHFLDEILLLIRGVSIRQLDPSLYDEVDHLFRARNSIAHRGVGAYRDRSGQEVIVTGGDARRFVDVSRRLITRLGTL